MTQKAYDPKGLFRVATGCLIGKHFREVNIATRFRDLPSSLAGGVTSGILTASSEGNSYLEDQTGYGGDTARAQLANKLS